MTASLDLAAEHLDDEVGHHQCEAQAANRCDLDFLIKALGPLPSSGYATQIKAALISRYLDWMDR